jgi:ParB family transcriptional regulator, chromosome partitioning protein
LTDTSPHPPAARRRGLGRGLSALLSSSQPPDGAAETEDGTLIEVSVDRIAPNPEQPRRDFDDAQMAELAESLRRHGMLQPIVVERHDSGYRLVAGERRLRAARQADMATVPAIVRPATESARHALELALVENLQRTDLNSLEEAAAYARLADTFGLSHEAIGLKVGRSRSAVTNTLRLLGLPASVQEALRQGRLSPGHARALLALPGAEAQVNLAREIEAEGLTVRQVEDRVHVSLASPPGLQQGLTLPGAVAPRHRPRLSPDDEAVRRGLEEALGSPVRLERRLGGGRVIVDFFSDEQLDAVYRKVGGPPL